jgi:protein-disulfide isomerase
MKRFAPMKRFALLLVAGLIPLSLMACQREQDPILEKLDEIIERLDGLEGGGGQAGARAAQRQPQPAQRPDRPDPSTVYAVPVGDSPRVGRDDAKVTIVEATDFACPFCYRVNPTINQLIEEYGDDLRVVYKNFLVNTPTATPPALASCAAHNQGKYYEMRQLIWEKGFADNRNLGEENMKRLAGELGLDMGKFEADMSGEACQQVLRDDQALLRRLGTRGTPNFYINGRPLSGAQPIEQFRAVIDEELKKAEERISAGTPASEYYAKYVLEEGKESL